MEWITEKEKKYVSTVLISTHMRKNFLYILFCSPLFRKHSKSFVCIWPLFVSFGSLSLSFPHTLSPSLSHLRLFTDRFNHTTRREREREIYSRERFSERVCLIFFFFSASNKSICTCPCIVDSDKPIFVYRVYCHNAWKACISIKYSVREKERHDDS